MALTRIYSGVTGLGQTIIRKLTDVGGPPASRVSEELDSIIAWAKDAVRCIHVDTTPTGNVGAGADVLHSFTLTAPHRLNTNGDYVRVSYGGTAVNGETINLTFQFDGQTTDGPGGLVAGASAHWLYDAEYVRVDNTTIRAKYKFFAFGFTAPVHDEQVLTLTVGSLGSDRVLRVLGESTVTPNNDDVVQRLSIIELRQQ